MRTWIVPSGALLLTAAVFLTTPVTTNNFGFDFDGVFYGAMAGSPQISPAMARVAPWCFRIATPGVARVLPWETLTSFAAIAFLSDIGSLLLLYLILQRLGFADRLSAFGAALFGGVFWTLKFSFYSPAYIDSETEFILLTLLYLTVTSRHVLVVILLVIAALQKESLAVFSLFSAAALLREAGYRPTAQTATLALLMVAAPLTAIGAVQHFVVPTNEYSGWQETIGQLRLIGMAGFWPIFAQSIFSGLGILPLVLVLKPRRWLGFLQSRHEWLVYCAITIAMLFAGRDKGRLFLYLLPVIVVGCVLVAEEVRSRLTAAKVIVWMTVVLIVHYYLGGYLTPMGTFEDYLARMVPEHSGATFLPFLLRNLAIAAAFLVFSVGLLAGSARRADSPA